MPEGDTIFRTARALGRALVGHRVKRFELPRAKVHTPPMEGARVVAVEPRGKHLLIGFDNGLTLHSHMKMNGSWHLYRPGEPWRRSRQFLCAVIETEDRVAVCFHAPVMELLRDRALARVLPVDALGPDILAAAFDLDEARARFFARGDTGIGEALLDQSRVAGIGNIFRCEALARVGIHPCRPVRDVDPGDLTKTLRIARALMQESAREDGRRAVYRVYRRRGKPCAVCGTAVTAVSIARRTAYLCPTCQKS